MENVPKLPFPCNQVDDYLNFHLRTFIQQLMEADAKQWADIPEASPREGEAII